MWSYSLAATYEIDILLSVATTFGCKLASFYHSYLPLHLQDIILNVHIHPFKILLNSENGQVGSFYRVMQLC